MSWRSARVVWLVVLSAAVLWQSVAVWADESSSASDSAVSGPDLVVESLSVSDSSPAAGASFTLSVVVRNQGDAASDGSYLTGLVATGGDNRPVYGQNIISHDISGLDAGEARVESIPLVAPWLPGVYYYGACVGAVPGESDTDNNCWSGVGVAVTVVGDPSTVMSPRVVRAPSVGLLGEYMYLVGDGFAPYSWVSGFVLHDPSVTPDTFDNGPKEAALCQRLIREGIESTASSTDHRGAGAIRFRVQTPSFGVGEHNYICLADNSGRAAVTDVRQIRVETALPALTGTPVKIYIPPSELGQYVDYIESTDGSIRLEYHFSTELADRQHDLEYVQRLVDVTEGLFGNRPTPIVYEIFKEDWSSDSVMWTRFRPTVTVDYEFVPLRYRADLYDGLMIHELVHYYTAALLPTREVWFNEGISIEAESQLSDSGSLVSVYSATLAFERLKEGINVFVDAVPELSSFKWKRAAWVNAHDTGSLFFVGLREYGMDSSLKLREFLRSLDRIAEAGRIIGIEEIKQAAREVLGTDISPLVELLAPGIAFNDYVGGGLEIGYDGVERVREFLEQHPEYTTPDVSWTDWQAAGLCDPGQVGQFADVEAGGYGSAHLLCMRASGLSVGAGGGYGPDRVLNRAQMASFLVRLWRDVLDRDCPDGGSPFIDVPAAGVHSANIACLYNLGIASGVTPTTYGPEQPLKASQISRFLYRFYQKAGGVCPDTGGSGGGELEDAVECLEALRVQPRGEGRGSASVTRAQMGVYLVGLWHNLAGKGLPPVPPAAPRFEVPAGTDTTATRQRVPA